MSNQSDLGTNTVETAAQHRERVLEAQREFERQQAAASKPAPAVPEPVKPVEPAPVAATATQVPPADPAAATPAPAATTVVTGNPEVDGWLAKKGFKTTEDVATSLRELEREMHRRAQEKQQPIPPAAPTGPMPTYPGYMPPPAYPGYQPQAPWMSVPPVPPAPQPVNAEQLARQYGFEPHDFERVAAVANDLAQQTVRNELGRVLPGVLNQVRQVNTEVMRQREMAELNAEPTWKNPQVQFEMHRVLEEDPTIVQRQPMPFRYAHDEALKRIARVNLGGPQPTPGTPTMSAPSTQTPARPPVTAGSNGQGGSGAAGGIKTQEVDPVAFAKMPLEQKREFLRSLGSYPGA